MKLASSGKRPGQGIGYDQCRSYERQWKSPRKGALVPRPLWNGSISFGLVNVPVRLFRAQAPQDIRFHQLHAKDGVRIQQKRVCPADGEEVAYEDIVKG
jgi:hypothetical protein